MNLPTTAGASGDDRVLVRFRGIGKTFDGETLVIKDLDLDIYRGEFLTLVGLARSLDPGRGGEVGQAIR